MRRIHAFGDRALLVELDGTEHAQSLAAALRADPPPGVAAVVPALRSVLVELKQVAATTADEVRAALAIRIESASSSAPAGRDRRIPVVYGGEHGPDLLDCAARAGLDPSDWIARHAGVELRVLFCGFAPGFAYLGELPPELRVPRLASPRTHTPPGSVAVAGPMSGIYPADLPGGWAVIGRTPLVLFDAALDPPSYLAPGDRVRFEPIAAAAWNRVAARADDW